MADINIYGTFKSQTGDGKLALASEIYDVAKGKFQSEINQEGGSSAAYETIDIGTQTDFHGTPPDGYYTISYNGNLYNDIDAIWSSGKIPVLKMALSTHTSAYSIPLYKAPTNDFNGHERAENGNYTIDVQIYSSQQRIITRSVGTYTKPSGGIPKTDLAQAVQNTLDKAENLDTELDETSTNAVQNKVIAKELNDNYAKKDGFYESMGVGTAVNLAGQELRNNDSLYRTSGGTEDIATGTARIEAIKGQTIAWNQMFTQPLYVNDNITHNTITTYSSVNKNTIQGHKYIFFTDITSWSNITSMYIQLRDTSGTPIIEYTANSLGKKGVVGVWGSANKISYANIKTINTDTSASAAISMYYQLIDLTLIYGAGNEPSTPEQFEADYQKWFGKPLTYEPYDEGSLKNVMLDGLKTIGFNQWDEEWELGRYSPTTGEPAASTDCIRSKNYNPILPSTEYYQEQSTYFHPQATYWGFIYYYDSNHNFISKSPLYLNSTRIFTTPSNARFFRFETRSEYGTTYNNDICINLSWSGVKNGTYEPYEENTISIPTTTMTGKLNGQGESVVIFPDGMKGVGDVHDELYYVGGKTYAVKRVGRVDLGSFSWVDFSGVTSAFQATVSGKAWGLSNILCGIYVNTTDTVANMPDKSIKGNNSGVPIYVKNTNYSDATTFKTAMSGVYLDYELAEPLVYEVDDFTLPARYRVNDWGTEEQLQASGANGIAAIISCLYGVNAVDILRNLPKNYISTESMDNFLAALGSAMGGTWTKTWNDNDGEYNFSFTANALTNSLTSNQEDI